MIFLVILTRLGSCVAVYVTTKCLVDTPFLEYIVSCILSRNILSSHLTINLSCDVICSFVMVVESVHDVLAGDMSHIHSRQGYNTEELRNANKVYARHHRSLKVYRIEV